MNKWIGLDSLLFPTNTLTSSDNFFIWNPSEQAQNLISISCVFSFPCFAHQLCVHACLTPPAFCTSWLVALPRSLLHQDAAHSLAASCYSSALCCCVETWGSLSEWRGPLYTGRSMFGNSQPKASGKRMWVVSVGLQWVPFLTVCVFPLLKYL